MIKSATTIHYVLLSLCLLFGLSSCDSSNSPTGGNGGNGGNGGGQPGAEDTQYVIAASSGENSYLLTTTDVNSGSISAQDDDAVQILGNRSFFFYEDFALYSFLYAEGDPGTVSSYILDDTGELQQRQELGLEASMQTRGLVDDEIVLVYSSRTNTDPVASFFKVNAITETVSNEIVVPTDGIAPGDEIAYFTDIAEYDDYILAGFRSISGAGETNGSRFQSQYLNTTFVAVYNNDLELQTVLSDSGRTGPVAGQTRSQGRTGIEPVENGDIYVFSSSIDSGEEIPSGILRINDADDANDLAFDDDYFFNITEASGGYDIYRTYYMGDDVFVVQLYSDPNAASASPAATKTRFAVVNVVDQTFEWVESGIPSDITAISEPFIDDDNNRLIYGITTTDTRPHLYSIDPETLTMTQGIEVVSEGILDIGKLSND